MAGSPCNPKSAARRSTRRWAVLGLTSLLLLGQAGCSKKGNADQKQTFPVSGSVLVNGEPLADALVAFHPLHSNDPNPVRSFARTRADGSFQVSTYSLHDGAPSGRYAITIIKQDDHDGMHLLPPRYADPAQSGFKVEIIEGVNTIDPLRLSRHN